MNLIDASRVFTATEIKEPENIPSASQDVLENMNVLNKEALEPTHRGEPLKKPYCFSIQDEGFRRAFPESGLRLLWKQREGMSAQILPVVSLVVFIFSVFLSFRC